MEEQTYDLGLLLVSGVEKGPDGSLIPKAEGRARCAKAAEVYRNGRVRKIGVIGGVGSGTLSFAKVYYDWMSNEYPDVPIAFVDASENCTAKDLSSASFLSVMSQCFPELKREEIGIGIITYRLHAFRAGITLRCSGFSRIGWIDSGEEPVYKLFMELFLIGFTFYDPFWQGFFGKRLTRVAEARVCKELRE